ncbi:hypothetical protein [Lactococcus sp.]|uniref:hypothetical protein n=1 Tax=Lactococcus sp. TaxID=44273 RepID=UPI0035AD82FB
MENQALILKTFMESDKMLDAKAVAALTGLEKTVVSKEIATLKKEGKLTSPKRCFYEAVK